MEPAAETEPAPPKMPLWVKVFVGLGILLVIVIVAVLLVGGEHGPGRHLGGGHLLPTTPSFG